MYETYFGLNKRPFRAVAAGTDVFVGPQTATTMAALKKAMTAPDTIVAVSGPVGSGKTTLVRRALDTVGDSQTVISVGRMQLGHDEVLELLLQEMGAELPAGTVQRFTTFRRLLKEQADKGTRVIVVVEDAARVGPDALSELEALTASDAGVSEGANIVLMGDQDLNAALKDPRLARLRQRLRLRQTISPLSAGELTAYFKHCFRLAGNEFDTLFEPGTAKVLHDLSGGIPRMANNLVESVLTSAAESKQDRIGVALIKLIATEEYGLEASPEAPAAAAPATPVEIEKVPEMPTLPVEEAPAELPQPEVVAEKVPASVEEDDAIPELIQDTLPDLEILAPNLATAAEAERSEVPEWERDPTLAQLRPDLDALEHAMAVAQGLEPDTDADEEDQNAPDKPPEKVPEITLDREIQAKIDEAAELLKQAELEAAEEEKAAAEASNKGPKATPPPSIHVKAPKAPQTVEKVEPPPAPKPAIKVEPPSAPIPVVQPEPPAAPKPVVQAKAEPKPAPTPEPVVQSKAETKPAPTPEPVVQAKAEPKPAPTPKPVVQAKAEPRPAPIPVVQPEPEPEVIPELPVASDTPEVAAVAEEAPPGESAKPDAALEKIAVDLARAKTIDDCDDKMAETLFGEEFSMMAAEVAANAPPELSANDEIELSVEESAAVPMPDFEGAAAVSVELESQPGGPRGKLDEASSQRLATVRALNGSQDKTPPPATPVDTAISEPPPVADHPESIEEQINTSMTQTLEALNTHRPPVDDDEDEDKGGFFSRFRRS